MKKQRKIRTLNLVLVLLGLTLSVNNLSADNDMKKKSIVYDTYHGENPKYSDVYASLLPTDSGVTFELNESEINNKTLKGKEAIIFFAPKKAFLLTEKEAIVNYLKSGGSILLIFDEERRMKLEDVEANDFVSPFGIEFTGDTPARHNCGALADKGKVCKDRRELPYSGGRSITGGEPISRVYDEGNYIHSAYKELNAGGKIILMSDGMAGLLMGKPDGIRFSGTGVTDSKYWGKDSHIFMQEILSFLIE